MSKISIIVPVYNNAKKLYRCIDSIIKQTYSNIEIILVNDGSTDNSREICEFYEEKDNRIIVLSKQNGGVSSARNMGLEYASGDYIAFVDSDDYIDNDMYKILHNMIIKENADIVECGYFKVDTQGKIHTLSFKEQILEGNKNIYKSIIKGSNTANSIWNKLFRATLFENLRFPEYSYSEDYFMNIQLATQANKKIIIEKTLYYYSHNEEGAMSSVFSEAKLDRIKVREKIVKEAIYDNDNEILNYLILDILRSIIISLIEIEQTNSDDTYQTYLNNKFDEYIKKVPLNVLKDYKIKKIKLLIIIKKYFPKLFSLLIKIYY